MEHAEAGGGNGGRRGAFPPPRKLSDEQELEVTRLYGQTDTPIADIAGRFGIGESSVYRIAQRHGAELRGRAGRAGRPGGGGGAAAAGGRAAAAAGAGGRGRARAGASAGPRRRYRVRFVAEAVIEAGSLREAVAAAEARGATDITAIAREE
jgi:transposase-like protein